MEVKPSLYNLMVVGLLALLFIVGAKVVFGKFNVPLITPLVAAA